MRRLEQELGFECPLSFLYKFKYHAQYGAVGAEHEYCWVYYGRYDGAVDANVNEIAQWRFVSVEALEAEVAGASRAVHAVVQDGMDAHQEQLPGRRTAEYLIEQSPYEERLKEAETPWEFH